MLKRFIVMTFALLVAFSGLAVAADKGGRLTIVEPVKEYGEVPKGETLDWSFVIKNTGDADLRIISVKPGCGCTVVEFSKVIKAGEGGMVTAHVDTSSFAGPISKTVTIATSDPQMPTAVLTIHATVKPFVEAYPVGFVRFNVLQGEENSQSLTIYSYEEEPFEVTKVDVPGDWVKADVKKIEDPAQRAQAGRTNQNQYKLAITVVGSDAKIGPLAEKIHLATNSKHQPNYYVSITGVIRPAFRVEPTSINFGEITPADPAAARSIMLRSNNLHAPETFEVKKAESTIPTVAASLKPTTHKGEFEVTLQVSKYAKPGDIDGIVKIYTNDKINPVVTVPIKGVVKMAAK